MQDLQGKTALVTGGATGIGFALAKALSREGMRLIIASTNAGRLKNASQALRESGADIDTFVCDVADRGAVQAMADAVGPIDLLCANAGVSTFGTYRDHRDEDYEWVIDVVLKGVVHCVQAFYPAMAARGSGQIVITGSQTAFAPDWIVGHGPYVPAKAAVHALALALREEAAAVGVEVSLLVPAYIKTDLVHSERSRPERFGSSLPAVGTARRPGTPSALPQFPLELTVNEAAARAVAGIRANAAIIATHAAMKPLVEEYFARVLQAYDDAAAFEVPAT